MSRDIRERFSYWWEEHAGMFWFDLMGKPSRLFWVLQEKCRAKIGLFRELDAFRALINLEPQLTEWPRAIPLLERALVLYETTHQTGKRDVILKRLAEVDPTNAEVLKRNDAAKKNLQGMYDALDEADQHNLETARNLVKETGRISTSMLQRNLGISYNHAAKLVEILRSEQK